MELIIDSSFQNRTRQRCGRVPPLSERPICVFHIHNLFVLVAQVMGSCREISGLQLANVAKTKESVSKISFQSLYSLSFHSFFSIPVCGLEMRSIVPVDLLSSNIMHPGSGLSSAGSDLHLRPHGLKVDGVEQTFQVFFTVFTVIPVVMFHVADSRCRRSDRLRAFLHREQCVHAVWVKQQ